MLSTIWRPWEDNRAKGESKAENQSKVSERPAVSREVLQFVLNCYDYFCKSVPAKYGAITETTKPLKLPKRTIERITERGGVKINGREKKQKKIQIPKIDSFFKNLIWQTIYDLYRKKLAQRWISSFASFKRSQLRQFISLRIVEARCAYIRKIGFEYQIADNHKVIMESVRLVAWMYKNLAEIERSCSKGYLISR